MRDRRDSANFCQTNLATFWVLFEKKRGSYICFENNKLSYACLRERLYVSDLKTKLISINTHVRLKKEKKRKTEI